MVPSMQPTLVVLAAGIGSRYGGLKQMDPVGPGGAFILDYSAYDAIRAGFGRIVFVISEAIEADFRRVIGGRIEQHVDVAYRLQRLSDLPAGFSCPADRRKPWGTGHAVLSGRDAVPGPFAVINADDFYGRESFAVLAEFLRATADEPHRLAMVGYRLKKTLSEHGHVARGVCRTGAHGKLLEIVERTHIEPRPEGAAYRADGAWRPLTGDELVSMNLWGFKLSFCDALDRRFVRFLERSANDPGAEFFVPSVVNTLIETQESDVTVLQTNSAWFGVTYPQDKAVVVEKLAALAEAGEYPARLWA